MTKKKKPKKATGFKKHILRNLTLLGVVGISFAGGAWWIATTPSATATEAVGLSNQTQDFIGKISGVAQELSLQYDLYPSVMIAQAILESQSGTSGLSVSPYYNLFGVKGQYNGQGTTFQTLEDDGKGNSYTINAEFRQYPSWRASLEDYAELLQASIYKGVHRSTTNNYMDATSYLTGRYATDTSYNVKLNRIIEAYNLTQYDDNNASLTKNEVSNDSSKVWNPYRRTFTTHSELTQDEAWLNYLESKK